MRNVTNAAAQAAPIDDSRYTLAARAPARGTWTPCAPLAATVARLVREEGMREAMRVLGLPASTIGKLASGAVPLRFGTIAAADARLSAHFGAFYLREACEAK